MPRQPRRSRRNGNADPAESAQAAGLRYVSDTMPGISRKRAGKGFSYVDPDGRRITDRKQIARIRSLAIPPAYTDVWICPSPAGHIQATGRDARGRKQYRYHRRWRDVRDQTKYARLIEFGKTLPKIRERVEQDANAARFPHERPDRFGADGRRPVIPEIDERRDDLIAFRLGQRTNGRDLNRSGVGAAEDGEYQRLMTIDATKREEPDRVGGGVGIGRGI